MRFRIYSASADDVKERLENGLLDLGLLMEPVDISRYTCLRMPQKKQWGVLVPGDFPLAEKEVVTPCDLLKVPLLLSSRETVLGELSSWFGGNYNRIELAATYNRILNAANMVENGVGAAICFDLGTLSDGISPLSAYYNYYSTAMRELL